MLSFVLLATTTPAFTDFGRIMPLGDALTNGTASDSGYRRSLANRLVSGGHAFSFVGTVKPGAKGEWNDPKNEGHEGHPGWRLTDLSGETAKSEGSLVAWLEASKPDTIILLAGSHDENDKTEEEYLRRYGTLLAQIGQFKKETRIVVGLLPSPDIGNLPESAVKAWNLKRSAAKKAAEAAKEQGLSVVVADANAKFIYRMDLIDRIHPTASGNEKIADALYEGLLALPAKP